LQAAFPGKSCKRSFWLGPEADLPVPFGKSDAERYVLCGITQPRFSEIASSSCHHEIHAEQQKSHFAESHLDAALRAKHYGALRAGHGQHREDPAQKLSALSNA
jgi:hypothetical protein